MENRNIEKEFIVNLLLESLKDYKSREFTLREISLILEKSTKIDNNKEKLDTFLNLPCKFLDGSIKTVKEISKFRILSLKNASKYILVENNKTLFDLYNEQRQEKLIKSGKYEFLFIKNVISYNEYDYRYLAKIISCDSNIIKELLSFNQELNDYSPSLYYFCFPQDEEDTGDQFIILKGEFQIWEGGDGSWLINSHRRYSGINVITYTCDSEIIYPSDKEVVKYLFPNITHCLEGSESDGWIIL